MKITEAQHKRSFFRDEAIAQRAVFHAARFLRSPLSNVLRYHFARLVRSLPIISTQTRDKFDWSVRKRDFRALSKMLTAQADPAALMLEPELRDDFRNTLPASRRLALLSDEHVRLLSARCAAPPAVPLTLSLVTCNSASWLDVFFASLHRQHYPLDLLTLRIADQSSNDDTVAKIQQFFAEHGAQFRHTALVQQDSDKFDRGHDANIMESDDDFVLVVNTDLELCPDTLTGLVASARADVTDVACWEPRLSPFENPKFYDPVTLETACCSHACIMLRRSAYNAVGGYERWIFKYGKDVELSYRLRGAGWKLRYLPHVFVRHLVDFEVQTACPHKLTGSIPANGYRHGSDDDGAAGEQQIAKALAQVPARRGVFPFNGLDYEVERCGHDIELNSHDPIVDPPKVSIITRTHGPNQGILREAIVSVLNQTYSNIEHLVVEDRGNLSEALVTDIACIYGTDIHFLRSDRGGRSAAGNDGLAAATGDLMLFLDNDDLLFADHVELLVRALLDTPKCVVAYSLAWEVETFFTASGGYREGLLSMPPAYALPYNARRFKKGNFLPIQSALFHRKLFDDLGGFDEEIDLLEDWNLWSRYSRMGHFKMVPKTTSIYRVPGDPVFREERQQVMRAAEDAVRRKNFGRQ